MLLAPTAAPDPEASTEKVVHKPKRMIMAAWESKKKAAVFV